jgi:DNA-directed RNA polymerase subunit K/omega
MAKINSELLLKSIENNFILVHLLTERVKELRKGARALVETKSKSALEIAAMEIEQGKLDFKYGSEG